MLTPGEDTSQMIFVLMAMQVHGAEKMVFQLDAIKLKGVN